MVERGKDGGSVSKQGQSINILDSALNQVRLFETDDSIANETNTKQFLRRTVVVPVE